MDIKELLKQKEGFSQVEIPEIAGKPISEEEDLFGEVGKEKIESLKRIVSEIKVLIKERESLSKSINSECEKIKTEINNFLLDNEALPADERDAMKEKNDLRAKKIAISELQLNEKIDCWKDVGILKRELRAYERELLEKEARLNSLNKLLKE
ncbi:MAG: hypothetical protein KC516_04385 [Nanoarchaeota archaeon]|nr:hypothetical protein [Nanoarchaeota archaeon]